MADVEDLVSRYEVRWSRKSKQTLEIIEADGTVHEVSSTQAGVPRSWIREASDRLSAEKLKQGLRQKEPAP